MWKFCGKAQFPQSDSPETMRKLCLSTKFPHQEIRWNYGILRSVNGFWPQMFDKIFNIPLNIKKLSNILITWWYGKSSRASFLSFSSTTSWSINVIIYLCCKVLCHFVSRWIIYELNTRSNNSKGSTRFLKNHRRINFILTHFNWSCKCVTYHKSYGDVVVIRL